MLVTPPVFPLTFLEKRPAWVSNVRHLRGGRGHAKGLWYSLEGACRGDNVGGGRYRKGGWMQVGGRHEIKRGVNGAVQIRWTLKEGRRRPWPL